MARLWDRASTNRELADVIGISVPAMSRLVDGLVNSGLVTRTPQQHDRRQVLLELSPEGRKSFCRLRKTTRGVFTDRLSSLSREEQRKLDEGLAVLESLFQVKPPNDVAKEGN
jgi:DNA-binding MarR family transcriptional regulator